MPRAYWKGYLRSIPRDLPDRALPRHLAGRKNPFPPDQHRTGHRLRQQMVDEETGRVVDTEHKGRGYEVSKGRYVPIDEDELKAVEIESTHTVDITGSSPRPTSTSATSTSPITSPRAARSELRHLP